MLDNQTETSDESSDSDDDENNDADVQLFASPDDSSTYFTSREWQIKLTSITNAYHSVKQPNEPNRIQRLLQAVVALLTIHKQVHYQLQTMKVDLTLKSLSFQL